MRDIFKSTNIITEIIAARKYIYIEIKKNK